MTSNHQDKTFNILPVSLPMSHKCKGKPGPDEREEYRRRVAQYCNTFPDYEKGFGRPSHSTSEVIWNVLRPYMTKPFDDLLGKIEKTGNSILREKKKRAFKQAFLIVLDTFIAAGMTRGEITYTALFTSLCRKYSDHFRLLAHPVDSIRDVRKKTSLNCRRDLLLNNVNCNELWALIVIWSKRNCNPLFYLEIPSYSETPDKGKLPYYYRIYLKDSDNILEIFLRIVRSDPTYLYAQPSGIKVLFESEKDPLPKTVYEVCAEVPYNEVKIRHESREILDIQSRVCLLIDASAFKQDYENAKNTYTLWLNRLKKRYHINPLLPIEVKTKGNKIPLRELHVNSKTNNLGSEEKLLVNIALTKFDRSKRHLSEFRRVYEQLKDKDGYLPIRSNFYRTVNRRYQPMHFWPTYVTADVAQPDSPFIDEVSLRKKWFKAPNPDSDSICNLIGLDISSSQTQIIATFLGDNKLESISSKESFKEYLATLAWELHTKTNELRFRDRLSIEGRKIPDYQGPGDGRLQELCKSLWMIVSYGGSASTAVKAQKSDPETFGPAWERTDAELFLKKVFSRFPQVKRFLNACRRIATVAYNRNPCAGVTFHDPLDGAEVKWNPVERHNVYVKNNGFALILSLPVRQANDDEYYVDKNKLRRMIAPCLVHMLDAYYSSLVMKNIKHRGVNTIVGIHDCWLVPESYLLDGIIYRNKEMLGLLRDAMDEAALEWYQGLELVYDDMLGYLDGEKEYAALIESAKATWYSRIKNNDFPRFFAK